MDIYINLASQQTRQESHGRNAAQIGRQRESVIIGSASSHEVTDIERQVIVAQGEDAASGGRRSVGGTSSNPVRTAMKMVAA